MKHLAIVSGFVFIFILVALSYISPTPFSYDEADYMYAARQGLIANYLDIPSYSFPEYVRLGLDRGRDPTQKSSLSQAVRKTGDVFFYRHAHGPVYFYWLNAISSWSSNEHFIRTLSLCFPAVTAFVIYLGCLWILPVPQGQIAGLLGCVLYLSSPPVLRTTEVAPHQMFVMFFILTLMLLAKLPTANDVRTCWYAAVCTTGVAFCTLEVTFVLIAAVLACGYTERRRLGLNWRLAWTSALLFASTVVVLHPAVITKLAFAKSYLYYAYLSVQRKAPWGDVTFVQTWVTRFKDSPVEWILVSLAVLLWISYRHLPGRRQAFPFLLFGVVMLVAMLRVLTTGLRYVLPYLPAFQVFTAIIFSGVAVRWRWKPALRASSMVLVMAALLLNAHRYLHNHPFRPASREALLIAELKNRNVMSGRLLVPQVDLPTLHYYFPHAELTGYLDEFSLPPGQFDAVVHAADPVMVDIVGK